MLTIAKAKSILVSYQPRQQLGALVLCIASCSLFLLLAVSFYQMPEQYRESLALPPLPLWLCAFTMAPALMLYRYDRMLAAEDYSSLRRRVLLGFGASVLALAAQVAVCLALEDLAWDQGRFAGVVLFLVGSLLALHIIPGVLMLGHLSWQVWRSIGYVDSFVLWHNPYRRRLLQTTQGYWLLLAGLWVNLFVLFFWG